MFEFKRVYLRAQSLYYPKVFSTNHDIEMNHISEYKIYIYISSQKIEIFD